MAKIDIRWATADDSSFLAWVMQAAARSHLERGVWDFAFPGDETDRLATLAALAQTKQIHFCHWSRFRVLELDGEPASALAGYEEVAHGTGPVGLGMTELVATLDWPEEKTASVGAGIAPFISTGYPSPEGVWIIESVATKPEFRGRGLIHELLLDILELGRKEGFTTAQIGYLLGNVSARSAYRTVGFEWLEDYCSDEFEAAFGTQGLARMQMKL